MTPRFRIVTNSPVRLWGLTCVDRLRRQLARRGVEESTAPGATDAAGASVILLDGGHLFDARVLSALVSTPGVLLQGSGSSRDKVVAAHVAAESAEAALAVLRGDREPSALAGAMLERPEELVPAFDEKLRRHGSASVLAVSPENRRALEDKLFADAYKGVTDFATKFWWPRPARTVTRFCVRFGITPNMVTTVGLMLVIAAGFLFARGEFALGLLAGWAMTLLDTVDGKLARVTVTSTQFGNLFDHATDLIHPPFWYLFWGLGLASFEPFTPGLTVNIAIVVLFAGYIVGRVVEGSFKFYFLDSGIFLWRRFDSFFRLITARRNPCILLLTVSLLFARPDLGLEAITWWTALTSAVLLVRFLMGYVAHVSADAAARPRSWLLDVDPQRDDSLAVRWFAPHPVVPAGAAAPGARVGVGPQGEASGG